MIVSSREEGFVCFLQLTFLYFASARQGAVKLLFAGHVAGNNLPQVLRGSALIIYRMRPIGSGFFCTVWFFL